MTQCGQNSTCCAFSTIRGQPLRESRGGHTQTYTCSREIITPVWHPYTAPSHFQTQELPEHAIRQERMQREVEGGYNCVCPVFSLPPCVRSGCATKLPPPAYAAHSALTHAAGEDRQGIRPNADTAATASRVPQCPRWRRITRIAMPTRPRRTHKHTQMDRNQTVKKM